MLAAAGTSSYTLTGTDSKIESNTAVQHGGGVYADGAAVTVTIDDTAVIKSNTATLNGGGVYGANSATKKTCLFRYIYIPKLKIIRCFSDNGIHTILCHCIT